VLEIIIGAMRNYFLKNECCKNNLLYINKWVLEEILFIFFGVLENIIGARRNYFYFFLGVGK
jgi:hypothetical protein